MGKRTRARNHGVVVTIAFAASCASSGSETGNTTPPPDPQIIANPPVPTFPASIVAPGETLLRRHEVCTIVGPIRACGGEPCPPPTETRIVCPDGFATDGRLERDYGGVCTFTVEVCPPPELVTCNPPPPRVVDCDPAAVESGLQARDGRGRCIEHVQVNCPPPYQAPCESGESRTVDCPPR